MKTYKALKVITNSSALMKTGHLVFSNTGNPDAGQEKDSSIGSRHKLFLCRPWCPGCSIFSPIWVMMRSLSIYEMHICAACYAHYLLLKFPIIRLQYSHFTDKRLMLKDTKFTSPEYSGIKLQIQMQVFLTQSMTFLS